MKRFSLYRDKDHKSYVGFVVACDYSLDGTGSGRVIFYGLDKEIVALVWEVRSVAVDGTGNIQWN